MAKKNKMTTRAEIVTQLAEACMDMRPGVHPFSVAVDGKKINITVDIPGEPRYGVETIEDAIEHTEKSLDSLRTVRDSLRIELGFESAVTPVDSVQNGRWYRSCEPSDGGLFFRPEGQQGANVLGDIIHAGRLRRWLITLPYPLQLASYDEVEDIEKQLREGSR